MSLSSPAWVAIFPMDSYTVIDWLMIALSQIDPHILISLQPIFHISVMRIWQKMEHIKRKIEIPHVRSATKRIIPCSNWCESDCWIQKFMTLGHKLLDSTVQFQYPGRLSQEKYLRRWEGCLKHMYTADGMTLNNTPWGHLVRRPRKTRWVTCWVTTDTSKLWLNLSYRRLQTYT